MALLFLLALVTASAFRAGFRERWIEEDEYPKVSLCITGAIAALGLMAAAGIYFLGVPMEIKGHGLFIIRDFPIGLLAGGLAQTTLGFCLLFALHALMPFAALWAEFGLRRVVWSLDGFLALAARN